MKMLRWFFEEDAGQGVVEYSLLIALIALVAVGALMILGNTDAALFDRILTDVGDAFE